MSKFNLSNTFKKTISLSDCVSYIDTSNKYFLFKNSLKVDKSKRNLLYPCGSKRDRLEAGIL